MAAIMHNNGQTWYANKQQLLDTFSEAVQNKLYERISYPIWRKMSHADTESFLICKNYDDITIYGVDSEDNYKILYQSSDISSKSTALPSFNQFLRDHWGEFKRKDKTMPIETINTESCINQNGGYSIGTLTSDNDLYWTTTTTKIDKPIGASTYYWTPNIDNEVLKDFSILYEDTITSINSKKEKEKENMNTNDLIKFDFGPVSDKQFRMSPYGIAVATNANGWVSYNPKTEEVFNVDIVNFDISKLIYKMPVTLKAIAIGDILIHGNQPVFVRSINSNGTISVLNYANSTVVDILPVRSIFGFNFFTKIVSLIDFSQNTANPDNPFGNILPFLMLDDSKENNFDPLVFMFMMNGNNFSLSNNPMLLYFLMSKKETDRNSLLPFLLMNSSNDFNFFNNINLKEEKK